MKRVAGIISAIFITVIFVSPVLATPFELVSTADKKISSHIFMPLGETYHSAYSFITGEERDTIREGISAGAIYYVGFDLNLDKLFSYDEISNYEALTDQKYRINTLNIQVKLKDDNYSDPFWGTDLGDDIPHEYGRIDIQLWAEDTDTFGGMWPNSENGTYEIDDGDQFTFSIDFSMNPLNYTDWYNHGEIIVTCDYPEFLANSDFKVDSVKVWGDRSLFVQPEPLQPVPEPSTFFLLGGGLLGLGWYGRKHKK